MAILNVSTINDGPADFIYLFNCFEFINENLYLKEFKFDFSKCIFLKPNAVAFLGGLARLIEHMVGKVLFNWETMKSDVRLYLVKNSFAQAFGYSMKLHYHSDTAAPYREDKFLNKKDLDDYLKIDGLPIVVLM